MRLRGPVRAGLLACGLAAAASAVGAAPDAPEDSSPAGNGAAVAPAPAAPPEEAASGRRWGLAPIRWGGSAMDELRWTSGTGQPNRFQHVQIGNLRAATFIWQPWLAQVSGGLGFVTGTEKAADGAAAGNAADARRTTITGNGSLALFPVSRFPFTATVDVTDSRASGQLTASDFVSKRLSLRQSYRPEQGGSSTSVSFDRSILEGDFGRDTVDAVNGSYATSIGVHGLDFSGSVTRNRRSQSNESSDFNRFAAQHTFRPDEFLSVDSNVSLANSELRLGSTGLQATNRTQLLQGNVFANWRPDEEEPLYVTGGGRFFVLQTGDQFTTTRTQSLNGHVGAVYNWSPNLTLNGSASVVQVQSGQTSTWLSTQSVGASYAGNRITFGKYSYDWNTSASLNNQIGGTDNGNRAVAGQFGHIVSRDIFTEETAALSASVSQNVALTASSATGRTTTLGHTAGLTLRVSRGDDLSGFGSLSASDSRSSGAISSQYQFVSLQLNGQMRFSRYSALNSNLTIQFNRQASGTAPATGWNMSAYGTASYTHGRAFGMRGLRYALSYSVNTTQTNNRLLGDPDARRDQVGHALEQRLDYRIGRMDLRLSTQFARVDGRRNALIFLQIGREFGEF